jgi:cystathionine beta-synthase
MKTGEAILLMNKEGISQLPVEDNGNFVGSIIDSRILHKIIENPDLRNEPVKEIMDEPLIFVGMDNTVDVLSSLIDHSQQALLVRDENNEVHIITQHDLLMAMAY